MHSKGGTIFAQIWHVGRSSHVSLQENSKAPVASVETQAEGVVAYSFNEAGDVAYQPQSKPRALKTDEIPRITTEFVQAACNAIAAGFDGIELHAANGYLFEQFISGALNNRSDIYGGSAIANRLRFTLETVDVVAGAIGSERIGIRLSPYGRYNDMLPFADEAETWLTLANELSSRGLAYVHISDQTTMGHNGIPQDFMDRFRRAYGGALIVAGGYLRDNAQAALDAERTSSRSVGRSYQIRTWSNGFATTGRLRRRIALPSTTENDTATLTIQRLKFVLSRSYACQRARPIRTYQNFGVET